MKIKIKEQARVNLGNSVAHMSEIVQELWYSDECINVIEAFLQEIENRVSKLEIRKELRGDKIND